MNGRLSGLFCARLNLGKLNQETSGKAQRYIVDINIEKGNPFGELMMLICGQG